MTTGICYRLKELSGGYWDVAENGLNSKRMGRDEKKERLEGLGEFPGESSGVKEGLDRVREL